MWVFQLHIDIKRIEHAVFCACDVAQDTQLILPVTHLQRINLAFAVIFKVVCITLAVLLRHHLDALISAARIAGGKIAVLCPCGINSGAVCSFRCICGAYSRGHSKAERQNQ